MPKYKQVTYGKGFALKVTPKDRGADVMHYLMFGTLLGNRSLEGVEWEEIKTDEPSASTKALARSMRET